MQTGKSTILGSLARQLKADGVPVVYVSMRATSADGGPPNGAVTGRSAAKELTSAAKRFFDAVGYPDRPSWVSLYSLKSAAFGSSGAKAEVEPARSADRFWLAVAELFSVCGELAASRRRACELRVERLLAEESRQLAAIAADVNKPAADRQQLSEQVRRATVEAIAREKKLVRPAILWDELHDLVHSQRLRDIGGELMFGRVASEVAACGLEGGSVRFCAAASGYDLQVALRQYTVMKRSRSNIFCTSDPAPSDVAVRLESIGFCVDQVRSILATCGTRVRTLHPFLAMVSPVDAAAVDAVLRKVENDAAADISETFNALSSPQDKAALALLLDKLCGNVDSAPIHELPQALREPFASDIFFLDCGNQVGLQAQQVRSVWPRVRGLYTS